MADLTIKEHEEIAREILMQLGGNRFVAMTGAREFVALSDTPHGGLMFRISGCKIINKCRITLDQADTYTIQFWYVNGAKTRMVTETTGAYYDMLQDLFKRATGLDTHL